MIMSCHVKGKSVTSAFIKTLELIEKKGLTEHSRNGDVISLSKPLMVEFTNPMNRVLYSPLRDANPFFHLFESLWMLAGRNDVAFIKQFNSNIGNYSDNGVTFHGAYGHRWRHHFNRLTHGTYVLLDQIKGVVNILKKDPCSRRAIIAMWDPSSDLNKEGKDLPCNTHIYFRVDLGKLNMTVCNRSNDIIWGLFGANAVHMSFLHEYVCSKVGVEVGSYYQITNNAHIYTNLLKEKGWNIRGLVEDLGKTKNTAHEVTPIGDADVFYSDLRQLFMEGDPKYQSEFFVRIVAPLLDTWQFYKKCGSPALAVAHLTDNYPLSLDIDWVVAGLEWLERRVK